MCAIRAKERRKVEESYGNWHPATGSKKAKSIRKRHSLERHLGSGGENSPMHPQLDSCVETEKAQSSYALRLLVFR
jgi:hypothetical protein